MSVETLEQHLEERGPRPTALAERALAERDGVADRQPWLHQAAETRQTSFPLVVDEATVPQLETLRLLFAGAGAPA